MVINSEPTNEFWSFDLKSYLWQQINSNNGPLPRSKHTAVVLQTLQGSAMVVFGGAGKNTMFGDLWAFYFETQTWNQLQQTAKSPHARCWHFAITVGAISTDISQNQGRFMQIFQGVFSVNQTSRVLSLNDSWLYDSHTNTWEEANIQNNSVLMGLFGSSAYDADSNTVFSFGGSFGLYSSSAAELLNTLNTIRPGCNTGSSSTNYGSVPCQPCQKGYYSEEFGAIDCTPCPIFTSTIARESISPDNCSVCDSSRCNGHGDCIVGKDGVLTCVNCQFGYSGVQCEQTTVRDIFIAFSIVIPFVFLVVVGVFRFQKKEKQVRLYMTQLDEAVEEITEAKSVFTIEYEDIIFQPSGLQKGSGSTGKVKY